MGRQIEQGERRFEERGVLAVEGTPAALCQTHGRSPFESDWKCPGQTINGIHIGILVRQSLLNKALALLEGGFRLRALDE